MSVFCCSLLGFSAYSSSERWHYINVIGVMYFFIFWIFYSHSPPSLHFSIRLHYTHFSLRVKQINKTITKRREKKSNFRKNLMFFVGRLQISRHQHAFISSSNLPKKMPISLFSLFCFYWIHRWSHLMCANRFEHFIECVCVPESSLALGLMQFDWTCQNEL